MMEYGVYPEQDWLNNPIMMIEGNEVFNNMRKQTVSDPEGGEPLDDDYINKMRGRVLEDGFAIVGAFGRHKLGKGGFLGGINRVASVDPILHRGVRRRRRSLQIVPLPLAQCIQACKIAEVPSQFKIAKGQEATQNYKAAQLQRHIMLDMLTGGDPSIRTRKQLMNSLRVRRESYLFIVEASIPLVDPIPFENRNGELEFNYSGITDQISAVLRSGVDQMTRDNTFTYAIEEDPAVRDDSDSNKLRTELTKPEKDVNGILQGQTVPVITLPTGEDVKLMDLPPEQQEYYVRLMAGSMAPPAIIKRDTMWMNYWLGHLFETGVITEISDRAYYSHLRSATGQDSDHFAILNNKLFEEPKTLYLNYYEDNGVTRRYPIVKNRPSVFDHVAKATNRME